MSISATADIIVGTKIDPTDFHTPKIHTQDSNKPDDANELFRGQANFIAWIGELITLSHEDSIGGSIRLSHIGLMSGTIFHIEARVIKM